MAFRVPAEAVDEMIPFLQYRGIQPRHPDYAPIGGAMQEPIVHGWMPAAAVFFRDLDGHLLELIAELGGKPQPSLNYVPFSAWLREAGSADGED